MLEYTRDYRRIVRLGCPVVDISRDSYYFVEVDDGRDVGYWYFTPDYSTLSMHAHMPVRWKRAAASAREALGWIFLNTMHQVVTVAIPQHLRHVWMLAAAVGFEFYTIDDEGHRCYFCTPNTLSWKGFQRWAA